MASQLAAGDVVRLKSGGPRMTVVRTRDHGDQQVAVCNWFDQSRKMANTFDVQTLNRVEDEAKPQPRIRVLK